jgi:hypothetical protein
MAPAPTSSSSLQCPCLVHACTLLLCPKCPDLHWLLLSCCCALQQSRYDNVTFNIFAIAPYGVPYAIWGFLFIIFTQRWLLPGHTGNVSKNLLLGARVPAISPLIGKEIINSE